MPTIKTKKEMNLPQLIEWGIKNGITSKEYICNEREYKSVIFSTTGAVHLNRFQAYLADDKFEVETEEEITENTKIPKLLAIFKSNPLKIQDDRGKQRAFVHNSESIQFILNKAKSQRENIDTIHIINDDNTHTLIWKNGKLVE